jgi:Ase1/PRC1/MAP65 family protein
MAPPSLDTLPSPAKSNSRSASSSSAYADPFLSTSVSTPTPPSRNTTAPLLFLTPDEPTRISDLECKHIFAQFVARVEAADESALDEGCLVGLEGVDPSPSLLQWSERTRADLEDIKRRREAHIQTMYDQLEALWRRLGVTEDAMDDFVEAHRGSTEVTVRAYEEELERMMDLKRERMGTFIGNARDEIIKLWDDLMIGEEERLDFAPFADGENEVKCLTANRSDEILDEHTEELLTIHEDEVKRLKDERRKKAPLLTSIKKYFEICDEEKELAAAASDQTRLLGRGVRGDPGRLLREEKMRKRVNKEKPRVSCSGQV